MKKILLNNNMEIDLYLCQDCKKEVSFDIIGLHEDCEFDHDLIYIRSFFNDEEFGRYFHSNGNMF